jgi:hypothetical protein
MRLDGELHAPGRKLANTMMAANMARSGIIIESGKGEAISKVNSKH